MSAGHQFAAARLREHTNILGVGNSSYPEISMDFRVQHAGDGRKEKMRFAGRGDIAVRVLARVGRRTHGV